MKEEAPLALEGVADSQQYILSHAAKVWIYETLLVYRVCMQTDWAEDQDGDKGGIRLNVSEQDVAQNKFTAS